MERTRYIKIYKKQNINLGLGKNEQGIVTPLMVKKTGEKYGIIINANTTALNLSEPKLNIKNFYNRNPTKILMVTNIVDKDEVNQDIYLEIREEFENYGTVIVLMLYLLLYIKGCQIFSV